MLRRLSPPCGDRVRLEACKVDGGAPCPDSQHGLFRLHPRNEYNGRQNHAALRLKCLDPVVAGKSRRYGMAPAHAMVFIQKPSTKYGILAEILVLTGLVFYCWSFLRRVKLLLGFLRSDETPSGVNRT